MNEKSQASSKTNSAQLKFMCRYQRRSGIEHFAKRADNKI